jgi:4-hydroxy-tetrahydrodipicolinate synthase
MVLTPFRAGAADVDHTSLGNHVSHLLAQDVRGLVALAVIAEPAALSRRERADALDTILDHADGRPVVATVMSLNPEERAADLREVIAPRTGRLAGLMLPVPSSDPRVTATALSHAALQTGLPLWVQDYPGPTGVSISLDDLVLVVDKVDAVVAVKCEAAPTFWRIHRLAAARPDLLLLSGLGGSNLVEDLTAGARGVACGISRPRAVIDAVSAWAVGDQSGTRAALQPLSGLVGIETQPGTSVAIRKEHWRRLGVIDSAAVRPPQLSYPGFLTAVSEELGYPARPSRS